MKNYWRNWDLMRVFRLVIGVIITVQGIEAQQWFLAGMGALFTLLPLLDVSMCSTGSCSVPSRNKRQSYKPENPTYEEVK